MTNQHYRFVGQARMLGQAAIVVGDGGAHQQTTGVDNAPNRRQQAMGGQQ
jgi:hypothetical protein